MLARKGEPVRRISKLLLAAGLALGVFASQQVPAGAAVVQTTDWIGGRYQRFNGSPAARYTTGTFLRSATTGEVFLTVNQHAYKSCPLCNTYLGNHNYENDANNWWSPGSIVEPTNPAYSKLDFALIRVGSGNPVAATNMTWNYCTAANCTSYQGGGTQKNANWAGSMIYAGGGASNGNYGWGVMMSKMRSGTSWGTLSSIDHIVTGDGVHPSWDFYGWRVTGITGCGVTAGDSGAGVWTGSNPNMVFVGIYVTRPPGTSWTVPGPSPCYDTTTEISNQGHIIAWGDIYAAYPNLDLHVVNTP